MEYHSDRFIDYSLMFFSKGKMVACLPANKVENTIISHQGLTYGGLIIQKGLKLKDTLEIFKALLLFLESNKISKLLLKQPPSFYTTHPAEEVEYLVHLTQAKTYRVDTASVIDYKNPVEIQSNRLEGYKKGKKNNLSIRESKDFEPFWNTILLDNLKQRHQAKPTHSLSEIALLASKFPNNIRQFDVLKDDQILGGATIFETHTTAHVQYISAGERKQEYGTLDFLFHHLITEVFKHKRFFDFGISNENDGLHLNKGLNYWKECFGARTYVHRFYEVETANHSLLNDVLI